MKPKVAIMPPPTKRRVRIRIGSAVYKLSVNVAITPARCNPGTRSAIGIPDVSESYRP